jgi:hypothetical protein
MDIQTSEPVATAAPVAAASVSLSAISWGAILAGAAVASAVSLLLFVLAAGLDLAAFSRPLLRHGSVGALSAMAAVTLIATQWIASAVGGYLTGRLRIRWVGTHTHEVFFRDTAHGLITWAVVTLFMALGLGSAASAVFGAAYQPTGAPLAASASATPGSQAVFIVQAPAGGDGADDLQLVAPAGAASAGHLLLAQDLGDTQRDDRIMAPDAARKDAALGSLLVSLSMLIGAFIASVAAAIGGRLRDLHP